MNQQTLPPLSINLHLTQRCNMQCRGCFAHYGTIDELSLAGWMKVLDIIASETSELYRVKLTFAGGEPTLLPYLPQLIKHAHALGMLTGIITNGTLIDDFYLDCIQGSIDWIGISIDSIVTATNKAIGRTSSGEPLNAKRYASIAAEVKARSIRLKVNTVINVYNHQEDFSEFIEAVAPDRWKIMQHLIVQGQNDGSSSLSIDRDSYQEFLNRHSGIRNVVPEAAASMIASYVMIDPSGRPYGNAGNNVSFGECVLKKGFIGQVSKLGYSRDATESRGGFYY